MYICLGSYELALSPLKGALLAFDAGVAEET